MAKITRPAEAAAEEGVVAVIMARAKPAAMAELAATAGKGPEVARKTAETPM